MEKEIALLLKEQNGILREMKKSIDDLRLLFEKYDHDYQTEVENQQHIPQG